MDPNYSKSLFGIEGKVAVVTGGGGVLCGTMARGLAKAGVKVAILDINKDAAQAVADEIKAEGGEAIGVFANVLDKDVLVESAKEVIAAYGTVDILINGAGGNKRQATTSPDLSFFDLPQDAFQWVFNLNFIGTLLATQVFGKILADNDEGVIVNIASVNAYTPLTKIPAYSAAKSAIRNFTEWFATHISQNYSQNIRVNGIAPGFFLTEQNRFLLTDEATGEITPRGQQIIDHTPMGRWGDPTELMSTLIWLVSPGSKFVHGITVLVDGGFVAFSGI